MTTKEAETRMHKVIENLQKEFTTIRTGRASVSILDSVRVDYYGSLLPINQVASINVPEAKLIEIRAWDQNALPAIEKAIIKADIGLTPNNDGKVIRINIPSLTEERRKELIKVTKKIVEDNKIAIRNIRREVNEDIENKKKLKEISEDDEKRLKNEIQKSTDNFISQIDKLLANKEKEILEI